MVTLFDKSTCMVNGTPVSPIENLCPSTVQMETPQYLGSYLASWGM